MSAVGVVLELCLQTSDAVSCNYPAYVMVRGVANDVVVRAPLPEMDEFTTRHIDVLLQDLKELDLG